MNEEKEPKEEQGQEGDSGRKEAEDREKESSPEPEETEEKKQEGSSGEEKEKSGKPESDPDKEKAEEKEQEDSSGQEGSEEQKEKSGPVPEESEEEVSESSSGGEKEKGQKPEDAPEKKETEDEEPDKKKEQIPEPESEPLLRHLGSGLRFLIAGILIFAVIYPGVLLLAGKAFWGDKSEGGLIHLDGKPVGAELIGQRFTSGRFFHPRPSSKGYDGMNSGSQNLGPYNEALTGRVASRLKELRREGIAPGDVPAGWVTESGSALDPHITPAAALLQIPRVSRASGLPESELKKMIDEHTEGKLMGLYGQERVNVLLLNLDIQKRLGGSK